MLISGPIALDSLPPIPWKNGGGITRTIAVEPPQAGMDDFLWRISMADIQSSGSFSTFPGIDRTILLWSGAGLTLRSPSWPDHTLTAAGEPFAFAGEADVSCELTEGPSQDLNLMVRRGAIAATMRLCREAVTINHAYDDLVVLCAQGSLRIAFGDSHEYTDSQEYILNDGHFLRASQLRSEALLTPLNEKTRFVYASMHTNQSFF